MSKVTVMIIDATGSKEQKASVPDDKPVGRILTRLVDAMNLPTTGPDGQRVSYQLRHKRTGTQPHEQQTLSEIGVEDDDVLQIVPRYEAG